MFKLRLEHIIKALAHIVDKGARNAKEKAEANGLHMQLMSFKIVFILHLLDLVLPVVNCASQYMQSKTADITTVCDLIKSTVKSLENMRNDENYSSVYDDAVVVNTSLKSIFQIQTSETQRHPLL